MKIQSIFSRLFLYFLIFTVILISILWIVQNRYLPQYYQQEKVKILAGYGQEIEENIGNRALDQTSLNIVQNILKSMNGRIAIFDRNGRMLHQEGMRGQLRGTRIPPEQLQNVLEGNTVSYHVLGTRGNLEFLIVVVPGENYIYLMQTHFQSIEQAISITRGFYLYLFIVGFVTALLLAVLFSKKIINPLVKLNNIAKEMTKLNFQVAWEDQRSDEIGQLGQSLNFLTDQLKKTIGELGKELQKEKSLVKMRKEFVSRVSHELQTPIAIIRGYLEALEDEIPPDEKEREEHFRIIEAEIYKMSNLIKEMLDLGQLESGIFKVNKKPFNYNQLMEKIFIKFEQMKNEKHITFDIKENLTDPWVMGDEYRIEQVFTNLLQNAVNHTQNNGSIKITVNDKDSDIWTEIYNEGEKILEKDLPYIWESFYKGESKKTGTGLGLAIVKNVLELHHSRYGIENMDKGVCFYFTIQKHKN